MTYYSPNDLYLSHHGILGMRWGVRRYQNEDGTLTRAGKVHDKKIRDKQDNSVTLLDENGNVEGSSKKKFQLTDKQKKYLKVGLAVAGVALAAYGGYRISQSFDITRLPNYDKVTGLLKKKEKLSLAEDISRVNPKGVNPEKNPLYFTNCSKCTATYELRRRGFDVTAREGTPLMPDVIDKYFKNATKKTITTEFESQSGWMSRKIMSKDPSKLSSYEAFQVLQDARTHAITKPADFKNVQMQHAQNMVKACESFGPKARGNLIFHLENGMGHSIAFENDGAGKVIFHDTQIANHVSWSNSDTNGRYFKEMLCKNNPYFHMTVTRTDNAIPNTKFLRENNIIKDNFNVLDSNDFRIGVGTAAVGAILTGGVAVKNYVDKKKAEKNKEKSEDGE